MQKKSDPADMLERSEPQIPRSLVAVVLSVTVTIGAVALFIPAIRDRSYSSGYDAGYDKGYDAAYRVGYAEGHDEGYDKGLFFGNNPEGKTRAELAMEYARIKYGSVSDSAQPKEIQFTNGQIIVHPKDQRLCPLSVEVTGNNAYYVYLDSVRSPNNDMAFMVSANGTVEVDVPIGEYEIYYAVGTSWYGKSLLFGDDTAYYKCDDTFSFYDDGKYYQGWTLELYLQPNGNLDTTIIDASGFPK